jgi:hypothetical protein
MNKFAIVLGATALAIGFAPTATLAQGTTTVVEVKRGQMLYTSDGKRVANVYRVSASGDAQLIFRSKMVTVAASTLSMDGDKLTTSLTMSEVRAL